MGLEYVDSLSSALMSVSAAGRLALLALGLAPLVSALELATGAGGELLLERNCCRADFAKGAAGLLTAVCRCEESGKRCLAFVRP